MENLESLKQQVPNGTDTCIKCYECDFKTFEKVTLKVHLFEKNIHGQGIQRIKKET